MWRKAFSDCSADNRLRNFRTLYPEPIQLSWEVRELLASVSPTPFVVDPAAASGDRAAILHLANLHLKSPD